MGEDEEDDEEEDNDSMVGEEESEEEEEVAEHVEESDVEESVAALFGEEEPGAVTPAAGSMGMAMEVGERVGVQGRRSQTVVVSDYEEDDEKEQQQQEEEESIAVLFGEDEPGAVAPAPPSMGMEVGERAGAQGARAPPQTIVLSEEEEGEGEATAGPQSAAGPDSALLLQEMLAAQSGKARRQEQLQARVHGEVCTAMNTAMLNDAQRESLRSVAEMWGVQMGDVCQSPAPGPAPRPPPGAPSGDVGGGSRRPDHRQLRLRSVPPSSPPPSSRGLTSWSVRLLSSSSGSGPRPSCRPGHHRPGRRTVRRWQVCRRTRIWAS